MKLLIPFILLCLVSSCNRSQPHLEQNVAPEKSISVPAFDTLVLLSALKLNHDDSSYIHQSILPSEDFHSEIVDKFYRRNIDQRHFIIDFRTVLQIYPTDNDEYFGTYSILYKNVFDSMGVYRIHQDSIEILLGMRDLSSPEVEFVDFNYDGFLDIIVSFITTPSGGRANNCFWRFDSTKSIFVNDNDLNSKFFDASITLFDISKEIISGGEPGTNDSYSEIFRWNGTTYEQYAQEISQRYLDYLISTRKELINGEWVIVKHDTTSLRQ